MSTRATYEFIDEHDSFTVYKHHDGYPEWAVRFIRKALSLAWPLPRFEADEFGAAFISANKITEGGVRLTHGKEDHLDTYHHYVITCESGDLYVEHHTRADSSPVGKWVISDCGKLLLEEMEAKYAAIPPVAP